MYSWGFLFVYFCFLSNSQWHGCFQIVNMHDSTTTRVTFLGSLYAWHSSDQRPTASGSLGQAQISQCGTVDLLQYILNHLYRFCSLSSPACTLLNLLSVSKCSISFMLLHSPCGVLSPNTSTHWVFSYKLCNHHNFLYGTLWHFIAISLILV